MERGRKGERERGNYRAIRSMYPHVVCNVPVSCKANSYRNQLGAWLDSDL